MQYLNYQWVNTALYGFFFCRHYFGYVVPQKYYFLNEYETQVMGFYRYQNAPYLTECLKRLASTLGDRAESCLLHDARDTWLNKLMRWFALLR